MSFKDIVIAGPDMSGTSTQVQGLVDHFVSQGLIYRDLRGTEIDALFHSRIASPLNRNSVSLAQFMKKSRGAPRLVAELNTEAMKLNLADMVRDDKDTYINPQTADVWVLEEPTYRGAGQVVRTTVNNAPDFGFPMDGLAEAVAHSAYRPDEFMRFRGPLRTAGKIIVRSRSEESAAFQLYDETAMPTGPKMGDYLRLPGNKVAFKHPPTDVVIVHAPIDWTEQEFIALKEARSGGRILDGIERDVQRQLLVNRRYASNWMEKLYRQGTSMHDSEMPMIHRIAMYDQNRNPRSKEEIQEEINGLF